MKVRKLMEMLNEMGPENDIFIQEISSGGSFMVEEKYRIVEVHQILHWTYINIMKDPKEDNTR